MINKKNVLLTVTLILFVINSELVISSTIEATNLFINKVFMSIFPFLILCDIFIYFNYHIFLGRLFGNILSKVFGISKVSASTVILSMISSHPSNAIFIKNNLDNKLIDFEEAQRLYTYTFFPSIMFVVGTIGVNLLGDVKLGFLLLLVNYLCNFCIGFVLRKKNFYDERFVFYENQKNNFFNVLKDSIIKAINTSFIILGNITIFIIIVNIFSKYVSLPIVIKSLLSGILEMTNGIVSLSNIDIHFNFKMFLISFLLNFSGLAIFFQGFSIISPYKFNYKKILVIKLIFSIICSSIFLFI